MKTEPWVSPGPSRGIKGEQTYDGGGDDDDDDGDDYDDDDGDDYDDDGGHGDDYIVMTMTMCMVIIMM